MISRIIQLIYNRFIRPHLPRKLAVCGIDGEYGGVVTRRVKLLDSIDVWETYESLLLSHLREVTGEGDTVLEVGGGFGVATVTAARRVGDGRVHTLEASAEHIEYVEEAVWLNGVDDRVEVENALVGPANDVWGDQSDSTHYTPDSLSDVVSPDVLVLDCEGAEGEIVPQMDVSPRVCLVEVHPHLIDSSALAQTLEDICAELKARGYRIVSAEHEKEKSWNVHVVLAVREE